MNKEEKSKRLAQIRRLEGLLAYAIKHNEVKEIERLRKALDALIATLQDVLIQKDSKDNSLHR